MNTSQRQDKALFLQPTVNAISTVLGLPSCIWLLDEATQAFQVAATADLSQEYINTVTLPLDAMSVANEVLKTGKTIIVEDIASDKYWRHKDEALKVGWKSAIVVPLWKKRRIIGILDVYVPKEVMLNIDEKMPILECFASQISATLRQVQGLETLNEVGALINVVVDHGANLFDRIMQSVQKVLDCKRVSIFLVDKAGELVREATSTVQIKRERFKPGEGLAWQVVETKKTLLVSDVRQYPQFVPGLSSDTEERSMLLSPLLFQNKCIGVISADVNGLNGFDTYDQKLMETLRSQIAIAIHNVQLFQSEQERIEEIERLRQIEQILNSNIAFKKVVGTVLDELNDVVEFNTASVQLIRGDHRLLIGAKGFPMDNSSPKLLRNLTDDPLIRKIVESREVFVLSDISSEPLWEHIPETFSVYSWIAAPLLIGDQVIGLLTIDHSERGFYTTEDGKKIAKFANQVAAAIHESSFFQLIRNQAEALTELNKLTYDLLSIEETPDTRKLLTNIAEIAKKVLKADLIELYEYRQDRNIYTLPQISVGKRLKPLVTTEKKIYEDSSIFQLIQRQEPLYAENVGVEPICSTPYTLERKDLPTERFVVRERIQSTAAIPLRVGNESMGLMFASYRTPQTFSKELREIIELFAVQAALAIKNARLYSGVNLKRKALVEIGQHLTAGIRLREHEVLEVIYDQARKRLGMHNLTIAFYDETTDTIRFALGTVDGRRVDVEKEPGWESRQGGNGKTEWIVHNKQHLLLSTQEKVKEMRFSPVPGHKDYEGTLPNSWLGVPMIVEDKVLGVIANYDYGQDNLYNEDDIEILQALADYAAIAIDNARLYARVNDVNQRRKILVEIGQQLTAGIRLQQEKILERIYEQASRLPKMKENFSIALYDENSGKIEFKLAYQNGHEVNVKKEKGWEPRKIKGANDEKRGKTDEIVYTQKPLLLSTQEEVKKRGFHEVPGFKGYVDGRLADSWLGVPMRIGKNVLGVLATYHYGQENFYKKEDIEILQSLADQAVIVLENVHLYNSLKEREEKYRMLVEQALHMIIAVNMDRHIVEFNKAAQKTFGYSQEEILGKHVIILYADKAEADAVYREMIEQGHCVREIFNKRKDGSIFPCRLSASILRDVQGKPLGIMGVSLDITEQKRAEHKLKTLIDVGQELTSNIQRSENEILRLIYNKASQLMDTTDMSIALYDEVSKTVRFGLIYEDNRDVMKAENWQPRKVNEGGRTEWIIREKRPLLFKTVSEAEEWYEQPGHRKHLNTKITPSWMGVPMSIGDKVLGAIAIQHTSKEKIFSEDDLEILQAMANLAAITLRNARLVGELQNAQEKIAEAQDILTRTGIATDVVHRINNLVGTIPIQVFQIREHLGRKLDRELNEYLGNIDSDVQDLVNAAQRLNTVSIEQDIDVLSELKYLIRQMEVRLSIKYHIHSELPQELPFIRAIAHEFTNILGSIIQNAIEAMPNGGTLTLKAYQCLDQNSQKWVNILISDTGVGISQDKKEFIFSPFYSSKEGHMGYGLWQAKNVIERLGGNLTYESEEGKGATFIVKIPATQKGGRNE